MKPARIELVRMQRDYSWDVETWFVPLQAALADVTAANAAWQPPGGGNTIWQIVNHLNFYNNRVLNKKMGQPLGPQPATNEETFGAPGDPTAEVDWQATVERTRQLAEAWREWLAGCQEADLDEDPETTASAAEDVTILFMHDVYHTGQIVQIRRQQGSWPATRG